MKHPFVRIKPCISFYSPHGSSGNVPEFSFGRILWNPPWHTLARRFILLLVNLQNKFEWVRDDVHNLCLHINWCSRANVHLPNWQNPYLSHRVPLCWVFLIVVPIVALPSKVTDKKYNFQHSLWTGSSSALEPPEGRPRAPVCSPAPLGSHFSQGTQLQHQVGQTPWFSSLSRTIFSEAKHVCWTSKSDLSSTVE